MEIYEELDDEGKVVSSRVTNASKGADKIDVALKKAEALHKLTPQTRGSKACWEPAARDQGSNT